MQRISITEADLTYIQSDAVNRSEAVFIPGFAIGGTAEVNKPYLCTTSTEFRKLFGSEAPVFLADQEYPKYVANSTPGFIDKAIPISDNDTAAVMIYAGSYDKSYEFAIKLLQLGFPVVYQRVNQYKAATQGQDTVFDCYQFNTTDDNYDTTTKVKATADNILNKTVKNKSGSSIPMYKVTDDTYDVSITRMYSCLSTANTIYGDASEISNADGFEDIKFITSGFYPTLDYTPVNGTTITNLMLLTAATRGDAVALIDHTDNASRDLTGDDSVYSSVVSEIDYTNSSFGAIFTPWVNYGSSNEAYPASAVYLLTYVTMNKYGTNWNAVAGVSNGVVSNVNSLRTNQTLTNVIADSYQADPDSASQTTTGFASSRISINAITYIKNTGYCIWGDRTLFNLPSADDKSKGFAIGFLHLRNLISDVKKYARQAGKKFLFQPNTDLLWTNFKSYLAPLLDQMTASSGLRQYEILKVASSSKTKISCKIVVYPIYSVESFSVGLIVTDDDYTVA